MTRFRKITATVSTVALLGAGGLGIAQAATAAKDSSVELRSSRRQAWRRPDVHRPARGDRQDARRDERPAQVGARRVQAREADRHEARPRRQGDRARDRAQRRRREGQGDPRRQPSRQARRRHAAGAGRAAREARSVASSSRRSRPA